MAVVEGQGRWDSKSGRLKVERKRRERGLRISFLRKTILRTLNKYLTII